MFGNKKFGGGGYSVYGTAKNISDAIKEQEMTNREGIQAEKEVKQAEWQVNLEKTKADREARLAQSKYDQDVKLANIKAEVDVKMKKTTAGLTSDQNFNVHIEGLKNEAQRNRQETDITQQKIAAMQQKVTGEQELRMKGLDCSMEAMKLHYTDRSEQRQSNHQITMGAMNGDHEMSMQAMKMKGKAALTALEKGGRSFRLNGNYLDFGDTRGMTKRVGSLTQGLQQLPLGFEAFKTNSPSFGQGIQQNQIGLEPSRNQAIALPGPSGGFVDSDDEDESINDSSLYDMNLDMEMEEMRFEGELKKEEMKLEQQKLDKGLEMQRLKLQQQNNEIRLAELALLAKQA